MRTRSKQGVGQRWTVAAPAATAACVLAVLVTGCLRLASSTARHEVSVKPGINAAYADTDVGVWVGRFETESREIYRYRDKIVEGVGLEPGMTVADVGAGTGLFTMSFAGTVGSSGKVIAVDIVPGFLQLIRDRVKEAGLSNVETMLCAEDSVLLPPDSVDLVFVCDAYHHFEYPRSTLASIRRALRPGGELMVIDFERVKGASRDWVLDHVRAGRKTVIREISSAGFSLVERVDTPYLEENYMLRFRKTR